MSANLFPHPAGYDIERAGQFASAALTKSLPSGGDQAKWGFATWFKRLAVNANHGLFGAGGANGGNDFLGITLTSANKLQIFGQNGSTNYCNLISTATFTTTTWKHLAVIFDSAQATAANRVKVFVDGSQVTAWDGTPTYPGQFATSPVNGAWPHAIGAGVNSAGGVYQYGNFRLADAHFIGNRAPDISEFGETDGGLWVPIQYITAHGTRDAFFEFKSAAALATDSAGNGGWTAASVAQSTDTPTNPA